MPARQLGKVVFSDEKIKLRLRSRRLQLFDRVDGVGGRRSIDFETTSGETGFAVDRGSKHFPSHRCLGRRKSFLMRRLRRQDKDNFVELKTLPRFPSKNKMSV